MGFYEFWEEHYKEEEEIRKAMEVRLGGKTQSK